MQEFIAFIALRLIMRNGFSSLAKIIAFFAFLVSLNIAFIALQEFFSHLLFLAKTFIAHAYY